MWLELMQGFRVVAGLADIKILIDRIAIVR
jgi:hypothetical protein